MPQIIARVPSLPVSFYYSNLSRFSSYLSFPVNTPIVSELLLRERIFAAPVTPLEYYKLLEAGCEGLSDFGLFMNPYMVNDIDTTTPRGAQAALVHAPFVLLVRKPVEECDFLNIGISHEFVHPNSEALLLTKVMLSFYWESRHKFHADLNLEDDAWLVSGGPYTNSWSKHFFGFPYAYDLTWEYYRWRKSPFMFYRWVCAPGVDADERENLIRVLRQALELNLRNLSQFANSEASIKGLNRAEVLSYLSGFGHRLGLWKNSAESQLGGLVNLLRESELNLTPVP